MISERKERGMTILLPLTNMSFTTDNSLFNDKNGRTKSGTFDFSGHSEATYERTLAKAGTSLLDGRETRKNGKNYWRPTYIF